MIVVESFAKSMAASVEALLLPDKILAEFINLTGQTMIFSGPIQPAILGALIASVKLHLSDEIIPMQKELKELINYFRITSRELDLPITTKDDTPIQLLKIGSMEKMYRVLTQLIAEGISSDDCQLPGYRKRRGRYPHYAHPTSYKTGYKWFPSEHKGDYRN